MNNWTREFGGDAAEQAEPAGKAELTNEEADRVNAYEARLQEVTSHLASDSEVDALLLKAKIEVAQRDAIASHQRLPAPQPREEARKSRFQPVHSAVNKTVSALGDVMSFWLAFVMAVFVISPHLDAANDVRGVLILAGVGMVFGALMSEIRRRLVRRYHRKESVSGDIRPWWHERMEKLARGLESREPSPLMRAVDVTFAVTALTWMVLPLGLGYILLKSKGRKIFDKQPRVGQGGRVFLRYKFNVLFTESGAPESRTDLLLIRSGIEQLPRLWNLLRGDLTLVGPKPENPALAIRYPQACRWVFEHRPGLTGPVSPELRAWLLMNQFDAETYLTQVVPLQSAYDKNYFDLPITGQFRIMGRALALLMLPLLVENLMASGQLRSVQGSSPETADAAIVPAMPADERPSAGEQVGRVTKWSRHEYDPAFA
ncbi:sugar transferase [Streptomyces sp. NPDC005385]|uniref:sugar transferase n=1 Tax=Streptomyces sp. NPDC005385 TaxID=3157039 RepID=UPI0033B1C473